MNLSTERRLAAAALASATVLGLGASPALAAGSRSGPSAQPLTPAAGSVAVAPATPRPHPAAGYTFLVERYSHDSLQQPSTTQLRLGRSTIALERMTWADWGARAAHAPGWITYQYPHRSHTTVRSYRVKVTANRIVRREATQVYTRLLVTFSAAKAPGYKRTMTFALPS